MFPIIQRVPNDGTRPILEIPWNSSQAVIALCHLEWVNDCNLPRVGGVFVHVGELRLIKWNDFVSFNGSCLQLDNLRIVVGSKFKTNSNIELILFRPYRYPYIQTVIPQPLVVSLVELEDCVEQL